MTVKQSTICIVDAYSTGADLAPLFRAKGWKCIHVQSSPHIPKDFVPSFRETDFIDNLVPASVDDFTTVTDALRQYSPLYVIAGTETGVIGADLLAKALDLVGNDPVTSIVRRDKFAMQEALRSASLASIEQCKANNIDDALHWASKRKRWPIVVKPVDSAGADGVCFCNNLHEVRIACLAVLGIKNKLNILNQYVLLQERLFGQQYFVNAVSIHGNHVFTEIWSDNKIEVEGASLICDKEELLPYEGDIQDRIIPYMRAVLDALGIQNGPSHSELIVTDRGPILIETAARMQGTILHNAVVEALGDSHVTCTVERYMHPERFKKRLEAPYSLKKFLSCVTLASKETGIVIENKCQDLIGSLPSFYAMFHTPEPLEAIEKTVDLFSNPGIIYLCSESKTQVEEDYKIIRKYESEGLLFNTRPRESH
jgi:predicted ATP-grasp superfamily ATP-dependent carboligase